MGTFPPFGYVKSAEDKNQWIIDYEAAEIVKEAFKLCIQGYGPTQIARILTERKVETPVVYFHNHGLPTSLKIRESSEIWSQQTVLGILENLEYTGCTVNFKSYKKSYKSKRRIELPREDWVIFENTQEAIVDKQTFDAVQKIRENKRRPTDMGEMSPLSGMLYCADCGKKMYLCRCTTMKQAEYFNCSSYRKNLKRTCTSHQITVKAITAIIQDDLKRTIHFAKNHNEEFLQTLRKDAEAKTKKELKENLREIEISEERIDKLDKIIESLYEDKVTGKISEERYLKMSDTYEAEQATLKERVKTLKAEIEKAKAQDDKILDFMLLIYKYSNFEELTPEILRSFIDKVIVHEKTKINGHYRQTVEIVYNFVGTIEPQFFDDDETYN